MNQKIKDFIGTAKYHSMGQKIFGKDGQMILDVRGWGAIQRLFNTNEEAAAFQDELGKFYADAINEKIEREKNKKELLLQFNAYLFDKGHVFDGKVDYSKLIIHIENFIQQC